MKFPFILPADKPFDAVGFGTNAVDFLISVPEYPAFNSKIELTDYKQLAGGEIATTVVGLQRLGLKTSYAGRFGTDAAGDFGLQSLRDENVDTRFAEQIEGAGTQIAFIVIDERNGERTIIWKRDERLKYTAADAPIEAASLGKVLHMTPHDTEACIEMAVKAKAVNAVTSVDIDNVFHGVERLLPKIDILLASREFPQRLFGIADERTALSELHSRFGCAIAGVTLGDSGSLLLSEGEFIRSDGFAVPGGCKDTTGAGDSFRTGFLYGLLTGESVETSARMANAVAALKCRAVGARTSLPFRDELEEMIKN